MRVLGFADQDSGQKGSERRRKAQGLRGERGAKAYRHRHHDVKLADAASDHGVHEPGHQETRHEEDRRGRRDSHKGPRRGRETASAGERRRQRQHGNDREILKQKDPEDEAALRGMDFSAPHQERQQHRRGRQGGQHPGERRRMGRRSGRQQKEEAADENDRAQHVKGPSQEKRSADLPQPCQREFEADHEEQHRDADLGQHFDVMGIPDEPERARADDRAGDEETDRRRDLEPPARQEHEERGAQRDDEIAEDRGFAHGFRSSR